MVIETHEFKWMEKRIVKIIFRTYVYYINNIQRGVNLYGALQHALVTLYYLKVKMGFP